MNMMMMMMMMMNFFSENRAVYEIMWKNVAEPDRPQMTIKLGVCTLHAG
jgi:hypothetical protein